MIIGIGNDIVDIRRIEKILSKFGQRFIDRCFTSDEINYADSKNNHDSRIAVFAKRFSAKEAISKAMGTGFSNGISMLDISIKNNDMGKPEVSISGKAEEAIIGLIPDGMSYNIHLSISDESPYSCSFAVIETK